MPQKIAKFYLQRLVEDNARHQPAWVRAVIVRPAGEAGDSGVARCDALALWWQLVDRCAADPDPLVGRAAVGSLPAKVKALPLAQRIQQQRVAALSLGPSAAQRIARADMDPIAGRRRPVRVGVEAPLKRSRRAVLSQPHDIAFLRAVGICSVRHRRVWWRRRARWCRAGRGRRQRRRRRGRGCRCRRWRAGGSRRRWWGGGTRGLEAGGGVGPRLRLQAPVPNRVQLAVSVVPAMQREARMQRDAQGLVRYAHMYDQLQQSAACEQAAQHAAGETACTFLSSFPL